MSNFNIWTLTRDVTKHNFENETSRRLNRNLWNRLTIDANMKTEFQFVKSIKESDMISTRFLWNHWINSIPQREKLRQINGLTSVIMNLDIEPRSAVKQLNWHFWSINLFFVFTRLSILTFIYVVRYSYMKDSKNSLFI